MIKNVISLMYGIRFWKMDGLQDEVNPLIIALDGHDDDEDDEDDDVVEEDKDEGDLEEAGEDMEQVESLVNLTPNILTPPPSTSREVVRNGIYVPNENETLIYNITYVKKF